MRVLHIIVGLNMGGAESSLFRLITHDSANTHLVVSLGDFGHFGRRLQATGVEVVCLGASPRRLPLGALRELQRVWHRFRPDVLQTWMYHSDLLGGLFAKLHGHDAVLWGVRRSTLDPRVDTRRTIWIARTCARLSHWAPRLIVSCGTRATEAHVSLGYNESRMRTIPNGYDLDQYVPDPVRRRRTRAALNLPDDSFLIGMVARYAAVKNHKGLLRALATLRERRGDFRAVLIGRGNDAANKELLADIRRFGLEAQIILLGERSDIPDLLQGFDLNVLSSTSEGFPNALCEAMATSVPCVTTNVGDSAEIVGSTGWVVPPKDDMALARAIETALDSCRDPSRRACARQRVVDRYSIAAMVQRYEAVWTEARDG